MFQRKEKAENCYYPTFLCMDVDAPDDVLDICHRRKYHMTEAAFLHEYIHYLQDITTLSGYVKIGTIVDQVKWVVNKKKGKLRIPYDTSSTYLYNIYPNAECMRFSAGRFNFKDANGNSIQTDITRVIHFQSRRHQIKVASRRDKFDFNEAILIFEDQFGIRREYEVGEYAISESMAYMIEQSAYKSVLPLNNDCPYMVVEKIVEHECPQAHNRLTMIAICDVCLNYPFPGEMFYAIVQKLKDEQNVTPALIYIMWKVGSFGDVRSYKNSWEIDSAKAHDEAIKQIGAYFLHEFWDATKDAALASLKAGWDLRQNNPTLFLDIAIGGPLWLNMAFSNSLSLCGCMCVRTSNNDVRYMPPKSALSKEIRADTFVCLLELYQILLTNKAIKDTRIGKKLSFKCSLKPWCSKCFNELGVEDITTTTYNCSDSPWENSLPDYRTQCEFGRLWFAYKLGKPKPRIK